MSTQSKHTPWEVLPGRGYGHLNGTAIRDARGYVIAVAIGDVPELDPEGVARLICTAPDMLVDGTAFLAAVEALCDWMNGNDLAADHADQKPEDYKALCDAMVSFRAALASAGQS